MLVHASQMESQENGHTVSLVPVYSRGPQVERGCNTPEVVQYIFGVKKAACGEKVKRCGEHMHLWNEMVGVHHHLR